MKEVQAAWRGTDDPDRVDLVVMRLGETGLEAHGSSVTRSYASAWSLDATDAWCTRTLDISVHGDGWHRALALSRDAGGQWSAAVRMSGRTDLAPPGLADPSSLDGALDCDIGLCPATNTMPVRRLGLLHRDVTDSTLVMAWVDVPSLQVIRSEQVYASGRGRVRFRSADGDFQAELTVDSDGIVRDYPGLARRLELS